VFSGTGPGNLPIVTLSAGLELPSLADRYMTATGVAASPLRCS
jgi:hypothetical protein